MSTRAMRRVEPPARACPTVSIMKKSAALALVAALALAALLALPGRHPSRSGGAWPEYAPGEVTTIAVRGPAGEYTLAARGEGWVLRVPGAAGQPLADPARVAGLLDFLARNKPLERVADPGPERSGLGAGASLTINNADHLEIGAPQGNDTRIFARRGEGGVFLLTREYTQVLGRPGADYLDMRLLDLEPGQVEAVVLARGVQRVEIVRGAAGPTFARPAERAGQPALAEALDLWLHEMSTLYALGPAPEAPAPGREPDLLVILRQRGSGEQTLRLFAPLEGAGPWTALSSRQNAYFLLDPGQVAKVDRNAFSFADRRLAALDPGAVDRLVLSVSGQELRAERDGRRWRSQGLPGYLTGIDMLLWRLTDLQYEFGPLETPPPGAQERLRLVLGLRGGEEREFVFHIDPALPPGRCWVSHGAQQGFYRVPDQFYKDLKGLLPPAPGAGSNQGARDDRARSVSKGDAYGQDHSRRLS